MVLGASLPRQVNCKYIVQGPFPVWGPVLDSPSVARPANDLQSYKLLIPAGATPTAQGLHIPLDPFDCPFGAPYPTLKFVCFFKMG